MPEEDEAVEAEKRKKPFPEQPIDSTQTDTALCVYFYLNHLP